MAVFLYSHWVALPLPLRQKIAHQFGIIKKGPTEVFDNTIKSDGFLLADIEANLNVDAIQKFIGTQETDMQKLWVWMLDKIEGRPLTGVNIDTTIEPKPEVVADKPKRGRKPKAK